MEECPQYSLQQSKLLTMPGRQALAEYELLMKEDNHSMVRTFLWAKEHWDNVETFGMHGSWYFHVANEAIDNA
jgi:hypothetical protein